MAMLVNVSQNQRVCLDSHLARGFSQVYGMLPKKDLDAILKRFTDPWLRLRQRNFQILLESYLHFIQPSLQLFTFSFMSLAGECWHISGSNCPLPWFFSQLSLSFTGLMPRHRKPQNSGWQGAKSQSLGLYNIILRCSMYRIRSYMCEWVGVFFS